MSDERHSWIYVIATCIARGNSPNPYPPVFHSICFLMVILSSLWFAYAFTLLLEDKFSFINFVYKCTYISLEIVSNHVKQ